MCKLFSADLWYLQLVKNVNSTLLRNHFWSSSLGFLCCFFLHRWKKQKTFPTMVPIFWNVFETYWECHEGYFFRKMTLAMNSFFGNVKTDLIIKLILLEVLKNGLSFVNIKPHFSLSYFFLMISFLCKKFYKSALFQ